MNRLAVQSAVTSGTKFTTGSDRLMTYSTKRKHCQSDLRQSCDIFIEEFNNSEELTNGNGTQENRGSRVRATAARGRRQPQSSISLSCIELDVHTYSKLH